MTKKFTRLFGMLLLLGVLAVPQGINAQQILVEATASPIVVNTAAELANLKLADGKTVLLANQSNGALLIYDSDATDTVNNSTVFLGPAGVGRYKSFALAGISSGVPAVPAEGGGDDISPATCTIIGINDATTDTTNFSTCVDVLNNAGGGTLYIAGTVSLNQDFDFTSPISIIGVPGTQACIKMNDNAGTISWNSTAAVLSGSTDLGLTATAAKADHIVVPTASNTLVAGDWFYAYSDDPVTGCTHQSAYGNNPGEVHHVKEIRQSTGGSDYIVFDDFIVDALTNGQKVIELPMLKHIKVEGLKFVWAGSTKPTDSALYFRCCVNVHIKDCHWVTPAPNEILFLYCGDSTVSGCTFTTPEDYDGTEGYSIVVGASNGISVSDCIAYGARHFFTTTAESLTETGTFTADSGTDTLTSNSHGHLDGALIRVSGTLPTGLSSSTNYYVYGATANTFQLSTSLNGDDVVNFTSNGSGTLTWTNLDRQGTPRNVLIHGVVSKGNGSATSTLVPFDTHAEGWGIVFDGCITSMPTEYQAPATSYGTNANRAFQTRSRNTTFKNCTVEGSGLTNGVLVLGENCSVFNSSFENCWNGVIVQYDSSGGATDSVNFCNIHGNFFQNLTEAAVTLSNGHGHTVSHNEMKFCATNPAVSQSRSIINITTAYTPLDAQVRKIRVTFNSLDNQNVAAEGAVAGLFSINLTNIGSTEIIIAGNTMLGYLNEGNAFTVSAGTNTVFSTSHGLANGDCIRVLTTGGLPGGLTADTDYYVRNRSSSTFQLSTTPSGSIYDITAVAGSGTHTWDVTTDSGLNWDTGDTTALQLQADSYNWTD